MISDNHFCNNEHQSCPSYAKNILNFFLNQFKVNFPLKYIFSEPLQRSSPNLANNNPINSIKIQVLLTFPQFSVISEVIKAIFVRRSVAMSREGLYVCMHVYIEQRARRRVYYQKSMPSLSLSLSLSVSTKGTRSFYQRLC